MDLDPPEYYYRLFGCCCYLPVTKGARLVAYLSLASFVVNLLMLVFSSVQSTWHLLVEMSILLVEFVCIVLLFIGISRKKAGYLKPYLFFGVIWNACLIMLWFICLVQLFDQNGFRFDVLLSVSELVELQTDLESFESTSFWLTILLIVGLTVTIIVGFWFLHIVLAAYKYFIFRRLELWDQTPENKQLLLEEPNIRRMADVNKLDSIKESSIAEEDF